MSIELLKELEHLKQSQRDLHSQLDLKINDKIEQSISTAFADFERFFREKDFQIQTGQRSVSASYGGLKAELTHQDPSESYMGAYFVFDLSLQLQNKIKHTVFLNPKDRQANVSFSTISNDPNERVMHDISSAKKDIEETKARIENFASEAWVFHLPNQRDGSNPLSGQAFDSIYDLLTALIN